MPGFLLTFVVPHYTINTCSVSMFVTTYYLVAIVVYIHVPHLTLSTISYNYVRSATASFKDLVSQENSPITQIW